MGHITKAADSPSTEKRILASLLDYFSIEQKATSDLLIMMKIVYLILLELRGMYFLRPP